MKEEKKISVHESGPSNFFVERTKSRIKMIFLCCHLLQKMSFQIAIFESGKSDYYLRTYDQFYLNCLGVCNVHYYRRDIGGKSELQIQHHCRSYI